MSVSFVVSKGYAVTMPIFYSQTPALEKNVYMRDAAYMVAITRVVKAMDLRGWLVGSA